MQLALWIDTLRVFDLFNFRVFIRDSLTIFVTIFKFFVILVIIWRFKLLGERLPLLLLRAELLLDRVLTQSVRQSHHHLPLLWCHLLLLSSIIICVSIRKYLDASLVSTFDFICRLTLL